MNRKITLILLATAVVMCCWMGVLPNHLGYAFTLALTTAVLGYCTCNDLMIREQRKKTEELESHIESITEILNKTIK